MPTVPTEQNRVGIAGVTDAKLQPGDYSGTGLQALGAGMQQLGDTGAKIAGQMRERQDRDDDLEVKKAWNAYAEGARGIRADALGKYDTDPQGMLDSMTREYGGLRDWIRSGLKNDRQRGRFDHVIAERFDYDMSGALGSAEQAMRRGQDQQAMLIERNAADDAVDNSDDPALFDKHLQTGAESIVGRSVTRGDDPATIEHSVTAYGSGIRRRAVESLIDRDPIAAADRYRLMRDQMTPADRQASEVDLLEPLARTVAAGEVDKHLLPEERDSTLSPERRATIAQEIEALPLTETLKRYALDDLADRGLLQARSRKQAADAARETSLATAEQLGSGFTSITQIPTAVRRDLDDATDQALRSMARTNLDPAPVAPGGETSLMMNIMASENPAALAKEDLRLIRGTVTPEEYDRLVRLQQGFGGNRPNDDLASQRRTSDIMAGRGFEKAPIASLIRKTSVAVNDGANALTQRRTDPDIPERLLSAPDMSASPQFTRGKPKSFADGSKPADIYLNLLSPAEDASAIKALKKMGSPPGWVLIYSHGSKSGAVSDKSRGTDGQGMSAHTLFLDLDRKGYKKGTPIILSSCFAANRQEALKLSKLTEAVVYAARAFVTVPNDVHRRYDMTVYSKGYGVGEKSGYARFENGREVPSDLLGLAYDTESGQWSWRRLETPMGLNIRVPYQDKSWLTELREGWHW